MENWLTKKLAELGNRIEKSILPYVYNLIAGDDEAIDGEARDKLITVKQAKELYDNRVWTAVDITDRTITKSGKMKLIESNEFTVKKGRLLNIDVAIPFRSQKNKSWTGCFVYFNININGTWYFIGNSGYDGAVMLYGTESIATYTRNITIDIAELCGIADQDLVCKVTIAGKAYNGDVWQNRGHEINSRPASNFQDLGSAKTKLLFTNLQIEEKIKGNFN